MMRRARPEATDSLTAPNWLPTPEPAILCGNEFEATVKRLARHGFSGSAGNEFDKDHQTKPAHKTERCPASPKRTCQRFAIP